MNLFASTSTATFALILATGVCFAQTPNPSSKTGGGPSPQTEKGQAAVPKQQAASLGKKVNAEKNADPFAALSPMGALHLSCDVGPTEIRINGVAVGRLPMPGPWVVKAGSHRIEFRTDGRAPAVIETTVASGAQTKVHCNPIAGTLSSDDEANLPAKYRWAPMTTSDVGFGIAIAGLVSLGVGAWYGRESIERADEAAAMRIRQTYRRDFERLADLSESSALAANLSFGIGTAALIGGLAMAFFGEGGLFAISGDADEANVMIQGEF